MTELALTRGLLAEHGGRIAMTLVLSVGGGAAAIGLLGVSGWFLTGAALTTAAASFNLFGPSALVRGLSFLRIGTRYGEKLVGHDVTLRFLASVRERLFRRLIPRVPLAAGRLRHGDLVSRLLADVEALDAVILTGIGPGVAVLCVGLGFSALLVVLLPPAVPIFAAGYSVAALCVPFALVLATRRAGQASVAHRADLRTAVLDGIQGHADIQVFGRAEDICADTARIAAGLAAVTHRANRAGAAASAAVLCAGGLTSLGVLLVGLGAVRQATLGGPPLVGLMLASLAAFEVVGLTVRNAGRFGAALAAKRRLDSLAQTPAAVSDLAVPSTLPDGCDLLFSEVGYSYQSERPVLQGLTLPCPVGSRTALVGESGCGKSTLLDLALRLADPDEGTVLVAGVDISAVRQEELHARVALMSQSTPVFLGTLRDNLRLARPDADDASLWQALALARLDNDIRALPEGLDTWCGEGGRTLSVGQARRLCLARTLLTGAAILLLDEPTSGLDRDTERAFLADLANATAGRTVLLVTHSDLPSGTVDRKFRLTNGRLQQEN